MEWAADCKYQGHQFSMWADSVFTESYFPRREDIDNPGEQIDAMLALDTLPDWNVEDPITREEALKIIFTCSITDALHEVVESIKVKGRRPLAPHADGVWPILQKIAAEAAEELLASHPRKGKS